MKRLRTLSACLLALFVGCKEEPKATVVCEPPAAVWEGEELLGQTPLALPVPAADRELILRAPGFQDAVLLLPQGTRTEVAGKLEPVGGHVLTCVSVPVGASVFVDGELMGETPLVVRDIDRDAVEVAFLRKNYEQVTRAVRFESDPNQTVEVVLPSLTEKHYRQRLLDEPKVIHHYCDLGRHYVLEHDFRAAMGIFAKGVDLLVREPDTADAARLWSEIDRVLTKQYDYGDRAAVAEAQQTVAKGLDELLRRHADQSPLPLFTTYIAALDTLNRRQRAQEVFDQAWKSYPNDQTLRRLARQRHFVLP